MLLFVKFLPEEYDTNKEKINTAKYSRVCYNGLPGCFHFPAPVNIIKDQDGVVVYVGQQLIKIPLRRFLAVIAIYEYKIRFGLFSQQLRKRFVEIAFNKSDVL